MSTVSEAQGSRTPIGSALDSGVKAISYNQQITFQLYIRKVLPLDGYVFWINSDLLTQASITEAIRLNSAFFNKPPPIYSPNRTVTVQGSLHYSSVTEQTEDANYSVNRVQFTSQQEIQDLNEVGPDLVYIAEFDGIRFAFSSRGSFYEQANEWHYVGNAIFSTMLSQIIDDASIFNEDQLVVSNSLPAWLAINEYAPLYPVLVPKPTLTLYPSFLSPSNLPPAYATIHVDPDSTTAYQALPYLDKTMSHYQLAHDRVVVTLYGLNNDAVMNFVDYVNQYTVDTALFGIVGTPAIPRDDKKIQSELGIIAMKKRVIFEVSYNQVSMRDIARGLIKTCVPTLLPQMFTLPPLLTGV